MNTELIKLYFDKCAVSWDEELRIDHKKINRILDVAAITETKSVIDIGCGTGVLIPFYLARKVKNCIAVDLSPAMIEIALKKFSDYDNIRFVCADAQYEKFDEKFDCAVIYNAFPHFSDTDALFRNLSLNLSEEGRITIAHGMGRTSLVEHHKGCPDGVAFLLPESDSLAEMMSLFFDIDTVISDDEIYIVSGTKKKL